MRNFHLTFGGKRYAVSAGREEGTGRLRIVVDGQEHLVEVEEDDPPAAALPLPPRPAAAPPKPAAAARPAGGTYPVVSPLPGVVLSIAVKEGDAVEVGTRLLVLEAMKMENIITAEAAGTVRSIRVQAKDKVETGQVLMEIA